MKGYLYFVAYESYPITGTDKNDVTISKMSGGFMVRKGYFFTNLPQPLSSPDMVEELQKYIQTRIPSNFDAVITSVSFLHEIGDGTIDGMTPPKEVKLC